MSTSILYHAFGMKGFYDTRLIVTGHNGGVNCPDSRNYNRAALDVAGHIQTP